MIVRPTWTAAEDARLRELFAAGETDEAIAESVGRSHGAVARRRARGLDLMRPHRGGGGGSNKWPQERVEALKRLWADGLSGSQVAARLGGGVTRSAVIGQVYRLGLAERPKHRSDNSLHKRAAKAKAEKRIRARDKANPSNLGRTPAIRRARDEGYLQNLQRIPAPEPTPETAVSIEHIKPGQCRHVIGDVIRRSYDTLFCGAAVTHPGSAWCAYHRARLYVARSAAGAAERAA